ncbi:MAG: chemotaxis protein CheA [Bacillota bacterium]
MFSDVEISVFLDELEEKIQVLSDGFLQLEKEGSDPQVLQEIFRAAHTVKGSSGVMGYDRMSRLTHEMENLFDLMRQGRLKINEEMVDVLFEALDTLKALRDEVTGQGGPVDIEGVIEKIRRFVAGGERRKAGRASSPDSGPENVPPQGILDLTEVEEEVICEAYIRGQHAYRIQVTVDSQCQMKSVRAFLVFQTLYECGEIIKALPPAEKLQEGEYDNTFEVILLTAEDIGRIRHLLMTISEIVSVEIEPVVLSDDRVQDLVAGDSAEEQSDKKQPMEEPTGKTGAPLQTREAEGPPKQVKTVRIDVEKLDNLMNLVGELVIDRTRLDRLAEIFKSRYGSDDLVEVLDEISNHLGQLTNGLQEQIMKARMLPVAQVFNRFPRMVRDLAHKLGKEIDFVIEGKETELDRNVIEVIGDPLIHLLRNAVDHGIEPPEERVAAGKPRTGTIRLKAFHEENHIVIFIEDDGRGIDVNKIRNRAVERGLVDAEMAERLTDREVLDFIFAPGFSLAEQVTDLSGRGVGMDVVRRQIGQINGFVELATALGKGTKLTIKLPLTLAIIRALMVQVDKQVYALPLVNVMETIRIFPAAVQKIRQSEVIIVRGQALPLVWLAEAFGSQRKEAARVYVVIVGVGNQRLGVAVERLLGEQEVVIKSLGNYLGRIPGLSGATILGDGEVALIVDIRGLVSEFVRGDAVEEAAYAAG